MSGKVFTPEDARQALQKYVDGFPLLREAHQSLGISGPYLFDLLKGHRPIPDRILDRIGLVREVTIKKKTTA